MMKRNAGLWIDHKKAVIVFLTGEEEEIKLIHSNIENRHGRAGIELPADDIRLSELTDHLNNFYNQVILSLHEVESIVIFGPGEAKGELQKRIEKDYTGFRIVGIEAEGKMTDPQIAAKVRRHFLHQSAAGV